MEELEALGVSDYFCLGNLEAQNWLIYTAQSLYSEIISFISAITMLIGWSIATDPLTVIHAKTQLVNYETFKLPT